MSDDRDDTPAPGDWTGSEVAIIGMAGRFPGAPTLDRFWENLRGGVESIQPLTAEEVLATAVDPAFVTQPGYVRAAAQLGDDVVERFDAALFGIPPHEARLLDPQQRLFLECAWEALERAGYNGDGHGGLIGLFAGLEMNNYLYNLFSNPEVIESAGTFQFELANDKDYLATRVSYKLDLRGPSLTVQTACSTSLVATHLACQALLSGECDVALAGGVSLKLPQRSGYLSFEGGMQSPDGHCRAFDARAQGTVFGSGAAVLVLKRLADALADGDAVHAVIRGTAINNDGSQKAGYSAPGAEGQYQVIRAAQLVAEVDPETITYVEAHGTGTALGDPIEVGALTRAFRAATDRTGFCALGSVKPNVGHLRSAAGATGVIKTVLALKHRELPPSINYERPNPHIDFAASPFHVVDRLTPWEPPPGVPRRAGVSSFGVGGTNAHVILEEAPPSAAGGPSRPWQLLLLSANTPTALTASRANLAEHLRGHPETPLADAAFTLQVGRRRLRHRAAVVCRNTGDGADAAAALESDGRVETAVQELRDRPVAFLFPGQGAQHAGMGREIYEVEPTFRAEVDRSAEILRPHLGLDLRDALFASGEEAERRLAATALAQPALFVIEHALARLWMEWGVRPQALLGHSVGEYVAACLSGVFSLEDALALVAERGRLMQGLPAGAMLAVPLAEAELAPLLPAGVSIAAANAPGRTVASGPEEAVAALEALLAERGAAGRRLHTSHAFHSAMMDPILPAFEARVRAARRGAPQIPFASNLTGGWISAAEAVDPGYWARHLRGAVRFADGLRTVTGESEPVLLEVGPGRTLSTLARQAAGRGTAVVRSLPHPKEERGESESLLSAVGQLWLGGAALDWKGFYAHERRRRVELPTYPFERQRFWVDRKPLGAAAAGARPNVRKEPADWFYVQAWSPSVTPEEPADGSPHRWLVFADRGGLSDAVALRLAERRDAFAVVTPVAAGDAFAETAPGRYALPPGSREAYGELFRSLREAGAAPDRVLHLWGVDEGGDPDGGFQGLLALAQELGREAAGGRIELRVATSGLQAVDRTEAVREPEKATALGIVRTLPLEHPEVGCAAIDVGAVDVLADPAARDRLAALLIAEALAPAAEPVAAYRGEDRFVERFEPVRLGPAPERLPVRDGGVYLVTGGLGGLGLVLAEELARAARGVRLVLAGRSGLPEREEWTRRLAAGEDDATVRRIRAVQRLEALGAEVMVAAADVTDAAAMAALAARARERFGAVHGAVHAAGVPGGGVIQLKTPEAAERVLAPKLRGTRALAAALAGEPLDWLALCSSTYAVLGGVGQVDYSAANSFLDAFARAWTARGVRTVSLGWGAWQEVGMAAEALARAGKTSPRPAPAAAPPAAAPTPAAEPTAGGLHPLLDRRVEEPSGAVAYASEFSPARQWVLAEHAILGTPAVPGTSFLEMARAAWALETGDAAVELRDVAFVGPLLIVPGDRREVRLVLDRSDHGGEGASFRAVSRTGDGEWQEHAHGSLLPLAERPERRDLATLAARCGREEGTDGWRAALATGGLVTWGPRWQSVRRLRLGDGEALLSLELPAEFAGDLAEHGLHPALLDVATGFGGGLLAGGTMLPNAYGRVRAYAPLSGRLEVHVHDPRRDGDEAVTLDVTVMTPEGDVLVEVEGFTLRRAGDSARRPSASRPASATAPGADWISPAEGADAFRCALARGRFPHVVVSPFDLGLTLEALRRGAEKRPAADEGAARFDRPELATLYAAPSTPLETALAEVWQAVLGLSRVGVHDNFFDLGGDSVIGIQMVAQAAARGLHFAPEQLFEHQTVAALAAWLGGSGAPEPAPEEATEVAAATPDEGDPGAFSEADLSPESLEKILARVRSLG